MGFNKPCIICGTLSRGTRCETHEKELTQRKEAARNSDPTYKAKKATLYGYQHQKARKQLIANATVCYLCGKPFTPTDKIDADHLIPGDPYSPLAATHASCNRSKGNKPLDRKQ
jgi:hypothetical protein